MAEGKLVIEVYEYTEDMELLPSFEFISCSLSDVLKNKKATLEEIIQRGFGKDRNQEKRDEILKKLKSAGINKIIVSYNNSNAAEPYVELTNVVKDSMLGADASRKKSKQNDIILHGKYRLSAGTETTKLKDAQRLSLIYSSWAEENKGWGAMDAETDEQAESPKEICLNITYLQE